MSKLTEYFVSNPVALDPGDLGITTENTGTTPATGAFKYSQLMTNRYKITPTVVSNDLVLALKHEDGNDPSTDRPLYFKIGNSLRAVTAATSITKADGTNWANLGGSELATKEADLFCYVIWNTNYATDKVDIFWSRIPNGNLYSDFSSTTTNEKYASIGATAPASTDECINIGRFAATLSAGAGYTWTVPTYTNINLIHRPCFESRWMAWTPLVSQGVSINIAKTVDKASYKVVGDVLQYALRLTFSGTGTAGSAITFTLPFIPGYLNFFYNGFSTYRDNGTGSYQIFILNSNSTNICQFSAASVTAEGAAVGANPNLAVAANDIFLGQGFLQI